MTPYRDQPYVERLVYDALARHAQQQDRAAKAALEARTRLDSAYQSVYSTDAPAPLIGEGTDPYRRRALAKLLPHSPTWKGVDLRSFSGKGLDNVESQVRADAVANAGSLAPPGQLREVTHRDRVGRQISEFVGDPAAWLVPFRRQCQYVTGIDTKKERA